jgi:hypothetical protein
MATFDAIAFSVIPDSNFFPNPEIDDEGLTTLTVNVLFSNASHHNSMLNRKSIATFKRSLGTRVFNAKIDYGVGAKTLIVPTGGGVLSSYPAVLTEFTGASGYGQTALPEYKATLKFVLLDKGVV